MTLQSVTSSLALSWIVHDSWSEAYVGARRLTYALLPPPDNKLSAEDAALCQLALVGASHLMEIALYKLLLPHAKSTGVTSALTKALLEEASYHQMLTRWLPAVSGNLVTLTEEPFLSTERLRRRRNNTVHKSSALATVCMARCALYSAVAGTRSLYMHASVKFPYDGVLEKYPQPDEDPFSGVPFPTST